MYFSNLFGVQFRMVSCGRIWMSMIGLSLFALFATSCTAVKRPYLLADLAKDSSYVAQDFQAVTMPIQPEDQLSIVVSSLNPVEDNLYNIGGTGSNETSSMQAGFIVDKDGFIVYRRLGRVKVVGKTLRELKVFLEQQLTSYLKEPIVTVTYLNHHVTVIGEVGNAQLINMPSSKMRMFDVLARSGNLAKEADLRTVLLIRDRDGKRNVHQLDLSNSSFLTSPFYYVEPNDVLVVRPDLALELRTQKETRFTRYWAVGATAINLIILLVFNLRR